MSVCPHALRLRVFLLKTRKFGALMMVQMTTGLFFLEGVPYTSYGIQCGDVVIHDVSLDKESMENLVALCNREDLAPVHVRDIVEDFLAASAYGTMDGRDFQAENIVYTAFETDGTGAVEYLHEIGNA